MKLQYDGQEVETITEGYWPEGVTLVCSNDGVDWINRSGIVCISNGVAFYKDGECGQPWKYWAIKPTKPATRRLTNREVAKLCRAGWDRKRNDQIRTYYGYRSDMENDPVPQGNLLRAPNSDEWLEPTSELLEVGK